VNNSLTKKFYFDSAHGWLEVQYEELKDLEILDRITHWSYRDGEKVYLEEDIDAGTYIDAVKEQQGLEIKTIHLDIRDNHLRNPEDRVRPRSMKRFYTSYLREAMGLGSAENWVGWVDKYKSGESK
tara:strand:- start:401 stop:778 length:378 start_codon:yes stop_codon:yes gene_type:complete